MTPQGTGRNRTRSLEPRVPKTAVIKHQNHAILANFNQFFCEIGKNAPKLLDLANLINFLAKEKLFEIPTHATLIKVCKDFSTFIPK